MFKSHFFVIFCTLISLGTHSASAGLPPDPLNDELDRQRNSLYRSCQEILVPPALSDEKARTNKKSSLVTARVSYVFKTERTLRASHGHSEMSTTGLYPTHRYEENPIHFRFPIRLIKRILKYTHRVRVIGETRREDKGTTPIELDPHWTIAPGEIAPIIQAYKELVAHLQEHSVILKDFESKVIKPGYSAGDQHFTTYPVISLRITDPADPAIKYLLMFKWENLVGLL